VNGTLEPCIWACTNQRPHTNFLGEIGKGAYFATPLRFYSTCSVIEHYVMQLRDIWLGKIAENNSADGPVIEVLSWLGRATLDIIGLAGQSDYTDLAKMSITRLIVLSLYAGCFKYRLRLFL